MEICLPLESSEYQFLFSEILGHYQTITAHPPKKFTHWHFFIDNCRFRSTQRGTDIQKAIRIQRDRWYPWLLLDPSQSYYSIPSLSCWPKQRNKRSNPPSDFNSDDWPFPAWKIELNPSICIQRFDVGHRVPCLATKYKKIALHPLGGCASLNQGESLKRVRWLYVT